MGDALRVVAHMASPLAGDAPHLDSLLVYVASRLAGKGAGLEGYKVDRKFPCPDTSAIQIPMLRTRCGRFQVARCSSPILGEVTADTVEHTAKRIGVEHAGLLAEHERKVVTTTNHWTKSYRLPLRVRRVDRIAWLCVGDRRGIKSLLKYVPAVGKKCAHGYGRVARWEVERLGAVPHDRWPWWCDSDGGPVLMRPLPDGWVGLPANLIGARADFGACSDPYWHQDRYGEIVSPC